jgi:hypothetical protein
MITFGRAAGAMGVALAAAASTATPAQAVRVVGVSCSTPALAAAITAANAAPALLRLSPRCTYLLTAALPAITGNVALVGGPSTTLKRDPAVNIRLLDVAAGGTLRVEGITLLNGRLTSDNGGGIRNAGMLILRFTTLSGNTTIDTSHAGLDGAALYNTGRAVIVNSDFTANFALTLTGINNGDGGGIYNSGRLTVYGSRFTANTAVGDGGAINTAIGGVTRVIQTTLKGNSASGFGGGVANSGTTSLDRVLVRLNQTIINNDPGGGIFNAAGTVTLRHSIVVQNSPSNCTPLGSVPGCTD